MKVVLEKFTRSLQATSSAMDVLEHTANTVLGTVPADLWCTVLLDPSTLLDTGGHHAHGFPDSVMPRLFEIEHIEQEGVDNLRRLADRKTHASALSRSARGELDSSVYFQDILRPLGLSDEMRIVLRAGKRVWGLVVMCRSGSTGFTTRDTAFARELARPASDALHKSLSLGGVDRGDIADAAGVLILDSDHQVVSMSLTARRWLADLQDAEPEQRLPNAVVALAMRTQEANTHSAVRSLALTRSSRWATLEGWAMTGHDGPRTVVSIGPADRDDLAAVILDIYKVTPRQRQVMQHVILGSKTASIATKLGVTPNSVEKHISAVYKKCHVSTRAEFMSKLFGDEYVPRLGSGPLTTDGRLTPEVD